MKVLKLVLLASLSGLVVGCSSDTESNQPSQSVETSSKPLLKNIIYRGRIIVGKQTQTLIPCDSNAQYHLRLSYEQTQALLKQVDHPYQEIYGEVVGYLTPPIQSKNSDYQAELHVKMINFIDSDPINQCSQTDRNTQALGLSPNWSATLGNNTIQFTADDGQSKTFNTRHVSTSANKRIYEGDAYSLSMSTAFCTLESDPTKVYGWSTQWHSDQGDFRGCGLLGNRDPSKALMGQYQAQSTQQDNFTVNLELKADHTAKTTYSYTDDSAPVTEIGYWQEMNQGKVQVVMTHYQNQPLVATRIFSRQGNRIQTKEEKIANRVYPIANGGLTLFKVKPSNE